MSGVAIVLILLISALVGYGLGRIASAQDLERKPSGTESANQEPGIERGKTHGARDDVVTVAPTNETEADAEEKEARDIRDVNAQEAMAGAAAASIVVALLSVGVAIYGAHLFRRQLNLTRELFLVERRPWLRESLSLRDARVFNHTENIEVLAAMVFQNIGQLPATNIHIHTVAQSYEWADREEKALGDEIAKVRSGPVTAGRSLLPTGQTDYRIEIKFEEMGTKYGGRTVWVSGVVEYQFVGTSTKHFTPFAWRVGGSVHKMDDPATFHINFAERQPMRAPPD